MTGAVRTDCEVCRNELTGRQQKFCSPYCRQAGTRMALLAERDAGKIELRCRHCDKVLDGRKTMWCSLACKRDHETELALVNDLEVYVRTCTKCNLQKPLATEFYKTVAGNYRRECRSCTMAGNKTRLVKPDTRDTHRQHHLRSLYGIDTSQYEELLVVQEGKCAVCRKPPMKRRLAVDHDHRSMKIRGLLCNYCNLRVIGKSTDATLYRTAAEYLDNPPADKVLAPDHRVPKNKPKKRHPRTTRATRSASKTSKNSATTRKKAPR